MATTAVIDHHEKDDIVVEIIQTKLADKVGEFHSVAYRYECRASRAGQAVLISDLTDERMPRNYRGAKAFGRKVFGIMKRQEPGAITAE